MSKYMIIKNQSRIILRCVTAFIVMLLIFRFASGISGIDAQLPGQALTPDMRKKYSGMLKTIKHDLKDKYYDQHFHGVDIDITFDQADNKLLQAQTNGQALGIIAQAMLDLNDSHTWFIPPYQEVVPDYGWQLNIIGDDCYVTDVKKDSDADKKGIKPGDRVLNIAGVLPVRDNFWKLKYLIYILRPQERLEVVVQTPAGERRQLTIVAELKPTPRADHSYFFDAIHQQQIRINQSKFYEVGTDLIIWKFPHFNMDEHAVDTLFRRVEGHKALILDLRGNTGGMVKTNERVLRNLFDHNIKVADVKNRYYSTVETVKSRGKNAFTGKLIILVDSGSASAAEITSRVIQLEKRGLVVGDRSDGAVMESIGMWNSVGVGTTVFFAESITIADVIMTDGKSLERIGVTPDELVIPTPADLAAHRDPVLSRAAALLGVSLDPAKAGMIYGEEKKPQ